MELVRQGVDTAVILVEQYFNMACSLADSFIVLDRSHTALSGRDRPKGTDGAKVPDRLKFS
jgi:ABC-type branched-subunit amino acid transport system ATPase component